jgi:hypothetical protein
MFVSQQNGLKIHIPEVAPKAVWQQIFHTFVNTFASFVELS